MRTIIKRPGAQGALLQRDFSIHPPAHAPGYKTSVRRSTRLAPISFDGSPAEATEPVFGPDAVGPGDDDPPINYAAPGERRATLMARGSEDGVWRFDTRRVRRRRFSSMSDAVSAPAIICVAITGSVPRKSDNLAVPITVAEQVESTQAAFEAGAAIFHCHVRNGDETPTSDPDRFAALKKGIERHCPGMIVQLSTGAGPARGRRVAAAFRGGPTCAAFRWARTISRRGSMRTRRTS